MLTLMLINLVMLVAGLIVMLASHESICIVGDDEPSGNICREVSRSLSLSIVQYQCNCSYKDHTNGTFRFLSVGQQGHHLLPLFPAADRQPVVLRTPALLAISHQFLFSSNGSAV
jgi:hypothetical protein